MAALLCTVPGWLDRAVGTLACLYSAQPALKLNRHNLAVLWIRIMLMRIRIRIGKKRIWIRGFASGKNGSGSADSHREKTDPDPDPGLGERFL